MIQLGNGTGFNKLAAGTFSLFLALCGTGSRLKNKPFPIAVRQLINGAALNKLAAGAFSLLLAFCGAGRCLGYKPFAHAVALGCKLPSLNLAAVQALPLLLAHGFAPRCQSLGPIVIAMVAQLTFPGLKMIALRTIPALLAYCHTGARLRYIPLTVGMLLMHTGLDFKCGVAGQPDPTISRPAPGYVPDHCGLIDPQTHVFVNRTHMTCSHTGLGTQIHISIIGNGGIGLFAVVCRNSFTHCLHSGIIRQKDPAKLDPAPQISIDRLLLQERNDRALAESANLSSTGGGFRPHIQEINRNGGINFFLRRQHRQSFRLCRIAVDTFPALQAL